jgi:uncharacterized repeat protein (TIGR01451 family)
MKKCALVLSLAMGATLHGTDLTLPVGGRVWIELRFAGADFSNTMSLVAPAGAGVASTQVPDPDNLRGTLTVPVSGCSLVPGTSTGLPGIPLISEKVSQRGCRVQLDANVATPAIDPFPAGTVLRFAMCAITDGTPPVCDYVWSSNSALNNGTGGYSLDTGGDHLRITSPSLGAAYANRIFDLAWEDLPFPIGQDFDDLVARVHVELDSDGDGLWDDWEEIGIDTDGNGTIDVDLPSLGANKLRKDIFVRVDYMDCNVPGSDCMAGDSTNPPGHNHALSAAAITLLENAFANAPVANPSGQPDGITLHIQTGMPHNRRPHVKAANIPGPCSKPPFDAYTPAGNFDLIKAVAFPNTDPRRFSHRYGLLGHKLANSSVSGCAELPGNDFMVTLGAFSAAPTPIQQASTFMHELGHTLGLQHGGNEPVNGKPNYISVMNYNFQIDAIARVGGGPARIDYSRGGRLSLNEGSLSEAAGIGPPPPLLAGDYTKWICAASGVRNARTAPADGAIDWDCSDTPTSSAVTGDVNGDRFCIERIETGTLASAPASPDDVVRAATWIDDGLTNRRCDTTRKGTDQELRPINDLQPTDLRDFNDWANLRYDFQTSPDFDAGVHITGPADRELDVRTYKELHAPDIGLTMSASSVAAASPGVGAEVRYTFRVKNNSMAHAENVVLTSILPAQLSYLSCLSSSGGVCGGVGNNRTVSISSLPGGETATITLAARLACTPTVTTILNTARVSTSSTDRTGGNNIASASVTASACAANTLPVSINRSVVTFNRATGRYVETVTLTNLGPALPSVAYVADELSPGAAMFMPNGTTSAALPAGSSYKELGPMAAGATITTMIEFTRIGTQAITYKPRILGAQPR